MNSQRRQARSHNNLHKMRRIHHHLNKRIQQPLLPLRLQRSRVHPRRLAPALLERAHVGTVPQLAVDADGAAEDDEVFVVFPPHAQAGGLAPGHFHVGFDDSFGDGGRGFGW